MTRTAQLNHSYSYWVCEKSDGVRVLFFLQTDPNGGSQVVYLVGIFTAFYPHLAIDATQIDRHNTYYEVSGFWFPHPDKHQDSLMDTILDGELVVDVEPTSKKVCTTFRRTTQTNLLAVSCRKRCATWHSIVLYLTTKISCRGHLTNAIGYAGVIYLNTLTHCLGSA
jgi:hypothetical protein